MFVNVRHLQSIAVQEFCGDTVMIGQLVILMSCDEILLCFVNSNNCCGDICLLWMCYFHIFWCFYLSLSMLRHCWSDIR